MLLFCKVIFFGNISESSSVHSCLPPAPSWLRPEDQCEISILIGELALSGHDLLISNFNPNLEAPGMALLVTFDSLIFFPSLLIPDNL